jgi:hypothetical protein
MYDKLKVEEFDSATDEQILDAADSARSSMSYYNAAEGNWSRETNARNACRAYLSEVYKELSKRELKARPGNYLL